MHRQWQIQGASRAPPPTRTKMRLISCGYLEKSAKSYVGAPLGGLAPSSRGNAGSVPDRYLTADTHSSGFWYKYPSFPANSVLKPGSWTLPQDFDLGLNISTVPIVELFFEFFVITGHIRWTSIYVTICVKLWSIK